jgi:hypothetical protein
MSEKELSEALVRLDGGLPVLPGVEEMTQNVLRRDRSAVRRLTILTVLAWLLADTLVVVVFFAMGLLMPVQAKLREQLRQEKITARDYLLAQTNTQAMAQILTLGVSLSVATLGVAAFLTLILVQRSRAATLRQVSASLLVISRQLEQLRAAGPKPGA